MIQTILSVVVGLTLLSMAAIVLSLSKSLKKTIYAYKNAALIGGFIFDAVLVSVLLNYYTSCRIQHLPMNTESFFKILTLFPEKFSYFALPVIIIMCLLVFISNLALIRHEGFRTTNLLGAVLGLVYLLGTGFIYLFSNLLKNMIPIEADGKPNSAFLCLHLFITLFLVLMLCYFECILLGTVVMGYVAAKHVPSYDKDYIIILGCSISKDGGLLPLIKERTNRAIHFAWEQEIKTGKSVKYVPSGGQGPNEIMSEGSAMELYLLSHGAEEYEVFAEKQSKNTYENLLYSKKIIDRLNPNAKIAFSTTNYHVYRSGILARHAGFDAEGIAGKTKWYFWPNGFIREFVGILSINKKAHIITALYCAGICTALGLAAYFGHMY